MIRPVSYSAKNGSRTSMGTNGHARGSGVSALRMPAGVKAIKSSARGAGSRAVSRTNGRRSYSGFEADQEWRDWFYRQKEVAQQRMLTREEEVSLARRIRDGDKKASQTMIESNYRLVLGCCEKFAGRGIPLADLFSAGYRGLDKAVEKFDPEKKNKFSTYAVWWIKQAIRREVAEKAHVVRLPIWLKEEYPQILAAELQFTEQHGRPPDIDELASASRMKTDTLRAYLAVRRGIQSLDAPHPGDPQGRSFAEVCEDPRAARDFEGVNRRDDVETVREIMSRLIKRKRLSQRDHDIVLMRFQPHTFEEVGKKFGVTRERVRQIVDEVQRQIRKEYEREQRIRERGLTGRVSLYT